MAKLIAVMGATGGQGGAVVDALLKDSEFSIRAITRNPESDKAKALIAKGVKEAVKGDADDVESLKKAFEGCYGAFIVTDYFVHLDMDRDAQQYINCSEAAKTAELKHVVLSTLEHSNKYVKGDIAKSWNMLNEAHLSFVPHFDSKAMGTQKFLSEGEVPTTELYTCAYYDNFLGGMKPQKYDPNGPLVIAAPCGKSKVAWVALEDIGKMTAALFKDTSSIGEKIWLKSSDLTMDEVAAAMSKVLGEKVVYNEMEVEAYAGLGFPSAADLANMFRLFRDHPEFANRRSLEAVQKYVPEPVEFEPWLEANKEGIVQA
jgi:uncharacterized protein YbjT (DUF2867 family)